MAQVTVALWLAGRHSWWRRSFRDPAAGQYLEGVRVTVADEGHARAGAICTN